MSSIVYNEDCVQGMKRFPDKHFDLAIVDPPYGIGRSDNKKTIGRNKSRKNGINKRTDYKNKKWDSEPPKAEYFKELFRVSKNQIIWGANHFISRMPFDSSCWIVWDKMMDMDTYASGEMAWTSFKTPMKIVVLKHSGFRRGVTIGRESKIKYNEPFSGAMDIHPTQKPTELYDWILSQYAVKGNLILDTHLGSGSSRIACEKAGLDFTGFELDQDYYEAQEKRFKDHLKQPRLFEHFELKSEINELPLDKSE